jgi:hypothetical protein
MIRRDCALYGTEAATKVLLVVIGTFSGEPIYKLLKTSSRGAYDAVEDFWRTWATIEKKVIAAACSAEPPRPGKAPTFADFR